MHTWQPASNKCNSLVSLDIKSVNLELYPNVILVLVTSDLRFDIYITNYEIPIDFFSMEKIICNSIWLFDYHEIRLYDEINAC